jgi:hypothetical protein
MAYKSTIKRARETLDLIEANCEAGRNDRSKAHAVRTVIERTTGVSYRTVMRYQKLLSNPVIEEDKVKPTIPFEW